MAAALANVGDRRRVVDLSGRTSEGSLAALLARAEVVVANDTGVAHLASAVRAPTVTVCGPDNAGHWAPRSASDVTVGGASHLRWPTAREVGAAIDCLASVDREGST